MTERDRILSALHRIKPHYQKEGFVIVGIFGSYARGDFDKHSDIDIVYELDEERFFARYRGFASASKVLQVKDELSSMLHKKVDLVSLSGMSECAKKEITKEIVYA